MVYPLYLQWSYFSDMYILFNDVSFYVAIIWCSGDFCIMLSCVLLSWHVLLHGSGNNVVVVILYMYDCLILCSIIALFGVK